MNFLDNVMATEHDKPEIKLNDVEARRMRLKNLIVLGKERGYLTYAEINDHLPDDMLDAEQIESIISMINDMGIAVYDEAPDVEALLMSDAAPSVADEDVVDGKLAQGIVGGQDGPAGIAEDGGDALAGKGRPDDLGSGEGGDVLRFVCHR